MNRRRFLALLGATALTPALNPLPVKEYSVVAEFPLERGAAEACGEATIFDGFSQTIAQMLIYGDAETLPREFSGFMTLKERPLIHDLMTFGSATVHVAPDGHLTAVYPRAVVDEAWFAYRPERLFA